MKKRCRENGISFILGKGYPILTPPAVRLGQWPQTTDYALIEVGDLKSAGDFSLQSIQQSLMLNIDNTLLNVSPLCENKFKKEYCWVIGIKSVALTKEKILNCIIFYF